MLRGYSCLPRIPPIPWAQAEAPVSQNQFCSGRFWNNRQKIKGPEKFISGPNFLSMPRILAATKIRAVKTCPAAPDALASYILMVAIRFLGNSFNANDLSFSKLNGDGAWAFACFHEIGKRNEQLFRYLQFCSAGRHCQILFFAPWFLLRFLSPGKAVGFRRRMIVRFAVLGQLNGAAGKLKSRVRHRNKHSSLLNLSALLVFIWRIGFEQFHPFAGGGCSTPSQLHHDPIGRDMLKNRQERSGRPMPRQAWQLTVYRPWLGRNRTGIGIVSHRKLLGATDPVAFPAQSLGPLNTKNNGPESAQHLWAKFLVCSGSSGNRNR
jgi:hypothetical protein